jgi:L-seryl-tRNA(Ser) seleniumtransferase
VDLVIFSGDKLLGGPQAGIIVGRRALVRVLGAHPLMRAVRVDKLTYGALEATLGLWAEAPAQSRLPIIQMLRVTTETIDTRARMLAAALSGLPGLSCEIVDGMSTIGGGSAPGSRLPTRLLALSAANRTATELARDLRHLEPPIIARIEGDRVVMDLRTVLAGEDEIVATAMLALEAREAAGPAKTKPRPAAGPKR